MKYFTVEELKQHNKEEVSKVLENCVGKNVKYNLAISLFSKYAKKLSLSKDAKVLDLGTASGYFLNQLHEAGYNNLYAHDIDSYLPENVKKLVKDYRLAELNTEKLPWPDNNFDIITAWCVLPHLENPYHAAREVGRVLKSGGIFMFTAPHIGSRPSVDFFLRKKYFAGYRETNNHIAMLPPSIVKKTFGNFFDLVEIDYLVTPKVFLGWRGKIRKWVYKIAQGYPKFLTSLKERWGYNIVYILKKK